MKFYESFVHALSGSAGGISAISLFYPLNNARLLLQVDEHRKGDSIMKTLMDIYHTKGIHGLYQGWKSCIISLGCSNFVYFYAYNALKILLIKIKKKSLHQINVIENLLIAAIAGSINVIITTPLWVAGTRLTVQSKSKIVKDVSNAKESKDVSKSVQESKEPLYKNLTDCIYRIYKEEGIQSLWQGIGPSLILVSNPSIQFMVYERCRLFMSKIAINRKVQIKAYEFFLMGAIAKAVATIITYPLQLAQSKLRVNRKKYKNTIDLLYQIFKKYGFYGLFTGLNAKLWQTVLTAAFQFLTYEEIRKIIFYLLLKKKIML